MNLEAVKRAVKGLTNRDRIHQNNKTSIERSEV